MNSEETQIPEQDQKQEFVERSDESPVFEEDNTIVASEEDVPSEPLDQSSEHEDVLIESPWDTEEEEPTPEAETEPVEALASQVEETPETVSQEQLESLEETPETVSQEQLESLEGQVSRLQAQKDALEAEINALQSQKAQILSEQAAQVQEIMGRMLQEGMRELEKRKQALQVSIEQLERRRERVRQEMRSNFAGVSQDIAIRVQGFKDYLVGSLQDLSAAAEQLELPTFEQWETNAPAPAQKPRKRAEAPESAGTPQFTKERFEEQTQRIQKILDQYRSLPDYYGPPWQLRRTFEPVHAERVQKWFLTQGGRGAVKGMGSRLQNILVASAVISVLRALYGDRVRTLLLANSPERLGEWRRGLQDCLGISRGDFGPNRGVVLFESPEAVVQKAERLLDEKQLPLIVIDETEDTINLSLLQFPLWLAFAPDPQQMSSYSYNY
ncbi:MAG: DUF3086 domain-containing protein [Cyanobacteriota bacterium]